MLHGFRRDECSLNNWIRPNGLGPNGLPLTNAATLLMENITFTLTFKKSGKLSSVFDAGTLSTPVKGD